MAAADEPGPVGGVEHPLNPAQSGRVGTYVLVEAQLAGGTQHPAGLGERSRLIGHRAEHQREHGGVEARVVGGQLIGDAVDDLDVGRGVSREAVDGLLDLHFRDMLDVPGKTPRQALNDVIATRRANMDRAVKAGGIKNKAAQHQLDKYVQAAQLPDEYLFLKTAPAPLVKAVEEGRALAAVPRKPFAADEAQSRLDRRQCQRRAEKHEGDAAGEQDASRSHLVSRPRTA